ncbi:response regulator transcription factor [bacterium]|jgi:DNA-binding CsgD family transcriptional regulator|nr:response regulator transcription factor [bacterium]
MTQLPTNQRSAMITAFIVCVLNVLLVGLILNCLYFGLAFIHRGAPPVETLFFYKTFPHVLGPIICILLSGFFSYRDFRKHPSRPNIHGVSIWVWVTIYVHMAYTYLGQAARFTTLAWLATAIGLGGSIAMGIHLAQRKNKRRPFGLSQRELEIAKHVKEGLSNKAIADTLFISQSTVKNHLKNIFQKTGATNRTELSRQI